MDIRDYFENRKGIGVLSTADKEGRVNAAIFARPHVLKDGRLAFIMGEKTTHRNLVENPHAAYLFKEEGEGWEGLRLYLEREEETTDRETINALSRRRKYEDEEGTETRYAVYFSVKNDVPLLGKGKCPVIHPSNS